jgi:Gpi18-like mannosyltransferase
LKSDAPWSPRLTVRFALASVLLVPFTLPYMHERYFYAADCIGIIYGFYFPRRFYIPLAVVMISLFSYFPFLFNDMTVIKLPYLALLLAVVLIIVLVDLCKELYQTGPPSLSETNASPRAAEAA